VDAAAAKSRVEIKSFFMKTAVQKTSSPAVKDRSPFFSRNSERGFLSSVRDNEPFFQPKNAIQTKLNIGKADDKYEREADMVADKVVQRLAVHEPSKASEKNIQAKPLLNTITPFIQTKCATCEKEEKLQKKEEEDREEPMELQRKPIFESNAEPPDGELVQRKCEECERAEMSGTQKKCDHCEEEEKNLQKKEDTNSEQSASTAIESRLNNSQGSGSPLPADVNSSMGHAFGSDFSEVRIHNDPNASELSKNLHAQAFTHGNDIYFNSGKYDASSTAGKHLLAHELTHTVQQGASGVNRKPDVQLNTDASTTAKPKEGYVVKEGNILVFHLVKQPLKVYANVYSNVYNIKEKIEAPKYKRETNQKEIWKKHTKDYVHNFLMALAQKDNWQNEKLLTLTLKHNRAVKLIGSLAEIENEIAVPFWDLGGNPAIHQVEHGIDWQILGEKADDIDNLILLDRRSNLKLGGSVYWAIQKRLQVLIDHYKTEFPELQNFKSVWIKKSKHKVVFDDFDFEKVTVSGSLISISNIRGVNTPYKQEHFELAKADIPPGHFVLKTNMERTGYLLPYSSEGREVGGFFMRTEGNPSKHELTAIYLIPIIKDGRHIVVKKSKDVKFECVKENGVTDVYFTDSRTMASKLRDFIGLKDMSPIEITESGVKEGFSLYANGKVMTDIAFLKENNIDITFKLEGTEFEIQAELSDIVKFPKPFQVSACSLVVSANSNSGLSIQGNIAFELGKFGQGEVKAGLNSGGFFLDGQFNFTNKWFNPAKLTFDYKKSKWTIGGEIGIISTVVPGLKSATLKVKYGDDLLSVLGKAELSVPGVSQVTLGAEFDEKGNTTFIAGAELQSLPGIKSGNVKITIKSLEGEEGLRLRAEGNAVPDFPDVPGLTSQLTFLYDNGTFDVRAKAGYKQGRFDGTIEVGITNKTVDEKGQPQGEATESNPIVVFGFGKLTVDLFKGIKGSVLVRLTPEKQVMVAGELLLQNLSPFGDGYHFNKKLIDFPRITIPLFGLPGLSISAFVDGSVNFKFDWQPLILKELKINFHETNIKDLDKISLDIHGSVGSNASAEVYMEIKAGLEARVLVATLTGALGGQAGLGISAEAGGELDASWDMNKGLQFKEVRAFLNVTPKAIFKLTGSVSVDLDLWITTVNLYYHEWVFAEKQMDMGGLNLKLDFPIKFDEQGNIILPEPEKMNLEKPDFSGAQGEKILDDAINSDAKKELEEKKQQIRNKIRTDLRDAGNKEDFSLSEYTAKMKAKYKNTPELQEFVVQTIEEECRKLEYEQFEKQKALLRNANMPLNGKFNMLTIFGMWHRFITEADVQAFKEELIKIEEEKRQQSIAPAGVAPPAAKGAVTPTVNGAAPASAQKKEIRDGNSGEGLIQKKSMFESNDEKDESNDDNAQLSRKDNQVSAPMIQLKEGDKHDLTSSKLSGNLILEQCFDNENTVSRFKNSKGEHVKLLQEALLELGFSVGKKGADEKYGEDTEKAVKQFQKAAGMSQPHEWDGIVGRKTINLLDRALRNRKVEGDEDVAASDFIVKNKKAQEKDEKCKGKPEDEVCGTRMDDIRTAADAAFVIVNKVISEQLEPKKTPQADYPAIFKRLFRNNDTRPLKDTVDEVKANYILIRNFILRLKSGDPTAIRCGTECDGGCRNTPVYRSSTKIKNAQGELIDGPNIITFCPDFPGHPDRLLMVIHESHHASVPDSADKAYEDTRLLDKLDHTAALKNAASFHVYAAWVNKPGSSPIGPAIPDTNLISDKTKKDAVNLSLAFLEMWFELVPFDISKTVKGVSDAIVTGVYKERNPRIFMEEVFHPWFHLTRPPLRPNTTDLQKLQAIDERVITMRKAFDKPFVIVETGAASFWERGPAQRIALNKNVLKLDTNHMIIALLQELVHATPDISAEREALYIGMINDMRNLRGVAP
jgi:hypothetical protein